MGNLVFGSALGFLVAVFLMGIAQVNITIPYFDTE
jgi:hypothetical protein